jgi:hypothetical protein
MVPGFVIQNPTDSDWKLYPQAPKLSEKKHGTIWDIMEYTW